MPGCLALPLALHPPQVSYKPDVFIVKSKGGATFEADLSEG